MFAFGHIFKDFATFIFAIQFDSSYSATFNFVISPQIRKHLMSHSFIHALIYGLKVSFIVPSALPVPLKFYFRLRTRSIILNILPLRLIITKLYSVGLVDSCVKLVL